ncbi:HDOD domain-containing protein [Thiovibrio frasassiensis]|jgi:HD-like signal output (HDOD) protein|uniref:HDOD domain-containing protein n=1 Tax=Thiovibrio frasassiensis TaxID=2984131 RepID=A0A9X4MM02_9BACT|nr:HDOD domain-containing protein [Thiovibrio frasassiensis]MDG4475277.1 HDOD domain-containing protein [Thiovibrio frasassiensis]
MNLRDFLKKIKELPTISAVANEINDRDQNDALTAKTLGTIITRDPALTATVLKLANSAYYGMAREITSIERAVTILGFDTIKNLALTISVFHVFKNQDGQLFDLKGLWYHSLGVGLAAKHLSLHSPMLACDKTLPEQAFICGILHDIGKIAFAQNLPAEMGEILKQTRSGTAAQHEIEKNILGFNHQKAGQAMANSWNFPEDYQTVIRLHHAPSAAITGDNAKITALVMSVYLGNKIAKALHLGESTDPHMAKVTPDDIRNLGINKESLPAIIKDIREEYTQCLEAWSYEL